MPLHSYSAIDVARHDWKRHNKGVLRGIAKRLGYSQVMVSRVFNGHQNSFDGRIEEALRELNAPGFEKRKGIR